MKTSKECYNELKKALSLLDLNLADSLLLEEISFACKEFLAYKLLPKEDEKFWKGLQKEVKKILSNRDNNFVEIKASSIAELIERIAPIFGAENTAKIICSFKDWGVFSDDDLFTISNFYEYINDEKVADELFSLLCKERCRRDPSLN